MITKEEHEARYRLYQEGKSDIQIARELYMHRNSILYWRNINDLKPNYLQGGRMRKNPEVDHG